MYVDIHAHLDLCQNLEEVLVLAKKAQVTHIISAGINKQTSLQTLELSKQHSSVHASIGVYPEFTETTEWIAQYSKECIAIGECGLDFHITQDEQEKQRQERLFVEQILLAKRFEKPLIVHSRKAELRVLEVLEQHNAKHVILHCFEGSTQLITRAIANKYYLTATSNIARSDSVKHKVALTPLHLLFTETDAPYMARIKGGMSQPADVMHTIEVIANLKKITHEECARLIFMNYKKMFG
ncbi:MAG: TatD family hydrolase [Candidatus Woesearchaeota archaeon]